MEVFMKRVISLALVTIMIFCMIPFAAINASEADTTVYFSYNGSECNIPAENADWNNGRKTETNGYNLDYYEKDLFAPATTLESGKVYKALYLFTIVRVNNEYDWEVKTMPTEEYYFNITNRDINSGNGTQKTVVSVPFKVDNPDDVKLKLWTHGALVDGSQLDKIMVVGADFDAYTVEGYDKVVEGLANAGSRSDGSNKPKADEYTASKRPLVIEVAEDGTVPGLTMTSYGMFAPTNGWDDSLIRFIGDTNGASYKAYYDGNQKFDQSIDEILMWCKKSTVDGTVDGFGNFDAGYVENKYHPVNGGNNYLLHWTGTLTANADVTFTPAAKKIDNGFVFCIGDSEETLVKKYEYWGTNYFDGEENLAGIYGDVTLEKGKTYAVEAWFMECNGGEALVFGGNVGEEFRDISTFGTFTLNEEYYKFSGDRWGNTDNHDHPYVAVFMDTLGDAYKGTGNGAQCIEENMRYDETIDGLLAASVKVGAGIVVPKIDKLTASFVDESFICLYDGTFTVEQTGYYLFGCIDVDNGLMLEITDGETTTRVFELWANATWQDNEVETWYPTAIQLEAGKIYTIHGAFLEMDGGQVVRPVVKYSETDNFDGAEAKAIESVLAFRTTIPADSDRLSKADAAVIYNGCYSITDKVESVTSSKDTWGDGLAESMFDGNIDTKYGSSGIAHTIFFTTSEAVKITHYGFVTSNDNDAYVRTPVRWTLLGSNDEGNEKVYTIIDHVNRGDGGLGWFASEEAIYAVDNPAEYKYYRLDVQANFSGNDNDGALSFAELLLYSVFDIEITNTTKQLTWEIGSESDLILNTTIPYGAEITVEGVDEEAYTVEEAADGTAKIVISAGYLADLDAGRYTVKVIADGYGEASATIRVTDTAVPTGDTFVIILAVAVVLSLGAAIIVSRKRALAK